MSNQITAPVTIAQNVITAPVTKAAAEVTAPVTTAGRDAYQLAVANGFEGTRAQWLASLQGAAGQSITVVPLANEAAYLALTPEQQMDPYTFYVIPE